MTEVADEEELRLTSCQNNGEDHVQGEDEAGVHAGKKMGCQVEWTDSNGNAGGCTTSIPNKGLALIL